MAFLFLFFSFPFNIRRLRFPANRLVYATDQTDDRSVSNFKRLLRKRRDEVCSTDFRPKQATSHPLSGYLGLEDRKAL